MGNGWHHAQLVEGNTAAVCALLEKSGVSTVGNPDVSMNEYQTFGVGEARALRSKARLKPAESDQQFFIISCATMTREAQNALLKLLEEPTGDSVFFFCVEDAASLLPTVRSRMQVLHLEQPILSEAKEQAKSFLAASESERITHVAGLLPKKKGEERDVTRILHFLAACEALLADASRDQSNSEGLRALYRARAYITDRGAPAKALLEQFALLTPVLR